MIATPQPPSTRTSPGSGQGGVNLAAIVDDVTRRTVRAVGDQLGLTMFDIHEGGAETALNLIERSVSPDLLLVDLSNSQDPIAAMAAIAEVCRSDTRVVALGMLNDIDLYRRLIEMGVSDYLVKPISRDALSHALRKATRGELDALAPAKSAKLIAMIGSRGGVGTTTLAVSAAWAMSHRQTVVLLDLDPHFGNVALSLDLTTGAGLREIFTNPARVDDQLLAAAMTRAGDNLRILGWEEPLEDTFQIAPSGLTAVFAELNPSADCIITDLPRSLDALSREVLKAADVIAVVTDQSLTGMRDTHRLLKLASSAFREAKCLVIANGAGADLAEVGRADFERGIETRVAVSIPFDAKAAVAAAQLGKAFCEVARSPRTVAELQALALALGGSPAQATTPSLLSRVLRK